LPWKRKWKQGTHTLAEVASVVADDV
jgi:hypothetical protein